MTKVTTTLLTLMMLVALVTTSHAADDASRWKKTLTNARQSFLLTSDKLANLSQQLTSACDNAALNDCDKLHPAEVFPSGYRIIPRLDEDAPASDLAPYKDEYSLETLEHRISEAAKQLDRLNLKNRATQHLINNYITLRDEVNNIQLHLDYHDYWQEAATQYARWFAKQNRLSKQAARLLDLKGTDPKAYEQARNEVARALSVFFPAAHAVGCQMHADQAYLTLAVSTDIESAAFRKALKKTVETRFSGLASALSVKLEMKLSYLSPEALYHGKPPIHGSRLDVNQHIRRFGDNTAVITSGAQTTHAFVGQHIALGGSPTTRRTLAHEVGHILGFNDIYLRSFVAHPSPRYGVVYSEWKGISNDIMGNNNSGEVTPAMRDTLVNYYCIRREEITQARRDQ